MLIWTKKIVSFHMVRYFIAYKSSHEFTGYGGQQDRAIILRVGLVSRFVYRSNICFLHTSGIFYSSKDFTNIVFSQIYRVTEEASVAETAVWPIPFLINMVTALINMITALKGS